MAKEIHDVGSEGVILLQVHQNLNEPAAIRPLVELAYGVCSDVGWRCEDEEQVYPRTRRKLPKPAHRSARDGHSRIGPQGIARWPDAPSALRPDTVPIRSAPTGGPCTRPASTRASSSGISPASNAWADPSRPELERRRGSPDLRPQPRREDPGRHAGPRPSDPARAASGGLRGPARCRDRERDRPDPGAAARRCL